MVAVVSVMAARSSVVLNGNLLDPGCAFNEWSAMMVDRKQGATSKDEKVGKPVVADQKQAVPHQEGGHREVHHRSKAYEGRCKYLLLNDQRPARSSE